MATVCTHCGANLPQDDVRFCNNCGAPISDHSLRSDARMTANEDAPDRFNDAQPSSSLPEQIARQPANPSPRSTSSKKDDATNVTPWLGIQGQDATNVTPWLGIQDYATPAPPRQPETLPASNAEPSASTAEKAPGQKSLRPAPARPTDIDGSAAGNANMRRPGQGARLGRNRGTSDRPPANFSWPEPMTHIATGHDNPAAAESVPQDAFPVLPSTPPPARELHTKIWDDVEDKPTVTDVPTPISEPASSSPTASQTQEAEIEDMPTRSISRTDFEAEKPEETTLTHLPTTPLSSIAPSVRPEETQRQKQNEMASSPEVERDSHIDRMPTAQWQTSDLMRGQASSNAAPANARSARGTSAPGLDAYPSVPGQSHPGNSASTAAPAQLDNQIQPPTSVPARPEPAKKAKKRSLLIALVAAVLIIVLALGAWLLTTRSSTALQATKPVQSVTDNTLGLTMEYPTGWQSNPTGPTLKLNDSSNTAEITIARADAGTTDPTKYLQQQATKLGMTDAKPGNAATFAGTNWQQISGDFQLSGASYVGTIYAGMHNNQLYAWTQMAPKNVAQDEEKLVFAPARSSLQFH